MMNDRALPRFNRRPLTAREEQSIEGLIASLDAIDANSSTHRSDPFTPWASYSNDNGARQAA